MPCVSHPPSFHLLHNTNKLRSQGTRISRQSTVSVQDRYELTSFRLLPQSRAAVPTPGVCYSSVYFTTLISIVLSRVDAPYLLRKRINPVPLRRHFYCIYLLKPVQARCIFYYRWLPTVVLAHFYQQWMYDVYFKCFYLNILRPQRFASSQYL